MRVKIKVQKNQALRPHFKLASKFLGILVTLFLVAACATPPTDPQELKEFQAVNDPGEAVNRQVFAFNQGVDKVVVKPVTGLYRNLPADIRGGIHNFLNNLRTPVILFNDVLQGEFDRAGTTLARFFINSTVGMVGFSDMAGRMGLEFHDEDFGQTLGVWKIKEGPYVMLPLLGPSNFRDTVGIVVDFVIDPLNWWAANTGRDFITYTRTGMTAIDARDQLWDVLDDLEKSSVDFYAALRSTYRQRRNDEIRNGEGSENRPAPNLSNISGDEVSTTKNGQKGPAE
jgi:phospholipid-binding lipoprotein MlaA